MYNIITAVPQTGHCDYYKRLFFTSPPQIYLTLIISDLYLYGTKMSPQFE